MPKDGKPPSSSPPPPKKPDYTTPPTQPDPALKKVVESGNRAPKERR
jgi:hypothetical protein